MQNKTKQMVLTALIAALVCIGTMLHISLPFGYANFGDAFLLFGSAFLSPVYAGVAGAVGAAMSDLVLGYAFYVPATFFIKLGMGIVSAFCMQRLRGQYTKVVLASVAAELLMVGGYFLYDVYLYGVAGAASAVVGNGLQGVAALCFAVVFIPLVRRIANLHR